MIIIFQILENLIKKIYPKKNVHNFNKLFNDRIKRLSKENNYFDIFLGLISLKTDKIEEKGQFHFSLKYDSYKYKSRDYNFQKCDSYFIYDLNFEPKRKWFKTAPPIENIDLSFSKKYFIFKEHIPAEEFLKVKEDFIIQSFNTMRNQPKVDILIILDLITECYDINHLNVLIKELAIICSTKKLNDIKEKEKIVKLKEYKTIIDKIALKEFQTEYKNKYFQNEEEKYFKGIHIIILFSYFKMEEYEKFKEYYFQNEDELTTELSTIYDYLDFFNSEIIISLIEKENISSVNGLKMCLIKSKNIEELFMIINKISNKINELLEKYKVKSIIIDKFPIFENDNIPKIIQLYKELLNQKNNNSLIFEEEIWFNYLEQFKDKNLEKIFELIEVKDLLEKKKEEFLDKSFNTIEETLFFEIEVYIIKNITIIDAIK